jgi:hypothetical protein
MWVRKEKMQRDDVNVKDFHVLVSIHLVTMIMMN